MIQFESDRALIVCWLLAGGTFSISVSDMRVMLNLNRWSATRRRGSNHYSWPLPPLVLHTRQAAGTCQAAAFCACLHRVFRPVDEWQSQPHTHVGKPSDVLVTREPKT